MSKAKKDKNDELKQMKKQKEKKTESKKEEFISMEEFLLIKQQSDEIQNKNKEYEEIIKRQQAEFDNYRKRVLKEKEEYVKYANSNILKDILSIVDNFDRALKVEHSDENKEFIAGFQMINTQCLDLLSNNNVVEVDGEGYAFDPTHHQAIQFEEVEDCEQEMISEVYQKGYLHHDRVLRNATVKVAKPINVKSSGMEDTENSTEDIDETDLDS